MVQCKNLAFWFALGDTVVGHVHRLGAGGIRRFYKGMKPITAQLFDSQFTQADFDLGLHTVHVQVGDQVEGTAVGDTKVVSVAVLVHVS